MKKIASIIIAIVIVGLLSSAATIQVTKTQPIKPKYFITKSFTVEHNSRNVEKYVNYHMKKGWIVTHIEGASDGQYYSTWIVVLEKY